MTKFGIVVPLYNKAPYVRKALESIVSQTYSDWELVVVDDGSKDESYSVAKQYLDEIGKSNCRIIQQQNAGVSTARNDGVAMLDCKYVCFLDADDWWAPTFLEEMDKFIAECPESGLYVSDYYYVKNSENRLGYKAETGLINYCQIYLHSDSMPIITGAECVPINVYNEFGGFKPILKLGEDFDLWLRISFKYKVAFLNKPLTYYNQDAETANRAIKKLHNPINTELYYYDEYLSLQPDNEDLKKLINHKRIVGLMKYYLCDEYKDWAKQELSKIDWSKTSKKTYIEYNYLPRFVLKCKANIMHFLSICKQMLLRLKYKILK